MPTPDSEVRHVAWIDAVCDDFEQGWLEGLPRPLEDLVRQADEQLRPRLFRELLAIEREYRDKAGNPLPPGEARERFAGLGPWTAEFLQWTDRTTGEWTTGGWTTADRCGQPSLPARIGGFQVVGLLGRGGMGVVYRAVDPLGQRQVAVKVMSRDRAANPVARERFLREARATMAVEDDHVVPVYQVGVDGDLPFLVMPVLQGESVKERVERDPPPSVELICKVGIEAARGLEAVHQHGLVHRDVTPGNVWLEGDPTSADPAVQVRRVKLLDFGLARAADETDGLTASGMVAGTPGYMAPEQAAGKVFDARADLFSLGAVLYRMATGEPAFSGPTLSAVLTALATHHPPAPWQLNPALPPPLSELIVRLLAKDPQARPASARAVAEALADIAAGQPVHSREKRTRRWWPAAVAAVLLLVSVAAVWMVRRPPPARQGEASSGTPAVPPPPARYRGRVDVLVERDKHLVRLNQAGALPLKQDDGFAIEAKIDPPAYLYVVWVDPNHDVTPVYPWDATSGWGSRPQREETVGGVRLPAPGDVYHAPNAAPGVATVVLFARPTPLDVPDAVVRGWFENLPELALAPQDEGAAVWFDDFRQVVDDEARRGTFAVRAQRDPFAAWQGRLFQVLGSYANCQSAVSFARTGHLKGK